MKVLQKSFKERVVEVVRGIEKGRTMTYGEVARRAGVAGASRAVGSIMSKNIDKSVPCHRVVRSDGGIGGYNGLRTSKLGTEAKLALLKKEGVTFASNNKVILN